MKNRIEAFAASHEDFPGMLKKAQQYLMARSKVDWTDSPAAVPTLRRSDSLGECRKRKSRIYTNMEWALMTLIMNLKRRVFFYLLHIKVHNKQANPNSIHSLRIHSVVVFPLL